MDPKITGAPSPRNPYEETVRDILAMIKSRHAQEGSTVVPAYGIIIPDLLAAVRDDIQNDEDRARGHLAICSEVSLGIGQILHSGFSLPTPSSHPG